MKLVHRGMLSVVSALIAIPATTFAQTNVTPDFGNVVTGAQAPGTWYVDRYAPATFQSEASFEGRTGVLDVGISAADAAANRPAPYSSSFYNTQGRKIDVNQTGAFSTFADVYLPDSWANSENGQRRTDLWGTMSDGANNVTGYPIIGFTNEGGAGLFRAWDNTSGWVNLANGVNYNSWNTLGFVFDGTSLTYTVNGLVASAPFDVSGGTQLDNIMVQAYNFGQPQSLATDEYDARWTNPTTTPEPSSMALLGTGLVGLVPMIRRRRKK